MKVLISVQVFVLLICVAVLAQKGDQRDRLEKMWAEKAELPPVRVHQLWRLASHFADETDDDSLIELLDAQSLSQRGQILLVTSAGEPNCLTLTIFSNGSRPVQIWQDSFTPKLEGICESHGIRPKIYISSEQRIVVTYPGRGFSIGRTHVGLYRYYYRWNGKTYRRFEAAAIDTIRVAPNPIGR